MALGEAPGRRTSIGPISPFFIVRDVSRSVAFYRRMGFELRFSEPAENPFFAIVGRGPAQILLKHISESVGPLPNGSRHEWAAWDGFVYAEDPEWLAGELERAGVPLHIGVRDRKDGLRGLEVKDEDGYVLFFGRPL
jgi:catechol 2,3-dioxygenase-like lactoylglutathione lyase family enzyme